MRKTKPLCLLVLAFASILISASAAAIDSYFPVSNGTPVGAVAIAAFKARSGVRINHSHHLAFESESFFKLTGSRTASGACLFTSSVTMSPGHVNSNRIYAEESIAIDIVRCEKIVSRGFASMPSEKFYVDAGAEEGEVAATTNLTNGVMGPTLSQPYWPLPPSGADHFAGLYSIWTDGNNPIFSQFPAETRPHLVMNSMDTALQTAGSPCQYESLGITFGGTHLSATGWGEDPFFAPYALIDNSCGYDTNNNPVSGGLTYSQGMGFVNSTFPTCNGTVNIEYNPDTVSLLFDGTEVYTDVSQETGPSQFCTVWHDHFWMIHDVPIVPKKFFLGNPPTP